MEKNPVNLELVLRYFSDFSPVQVRQLTALEELYKEWNTKINVISRKDIDSLYEKHVLHSLSIAAAFDLKKGMEIIDIGTGGGFPGIPLAIFFPEVHFHLVDSIGKKIKVVEAVMEATGLSNISVQHGRAEDIRNRKFDTAVSRAVAPLKELWDWSKPLLRKYPAHTAPRTVPGNAGQGAEPASPALPVPNGLICLKGGDLSMEISESGCRPRMMEIHQIFSEDYFREKYLLYNPL
ncbi:16S rRNA (guanine(527)-N(7))-methyltransferase RsmG [Flavitalea flava]